MTKIAVDLDDTLVPTVEHVLKDLEKTNRFPMFKGYHSLSDFSKKEQTIFYLYVRELLNTIDITDFKPIPGSYEVLKKLKKDRKNELFVVTSRNSLIVKNTINWVKKYYPDIFDFVKFGEYDKNEKPTRTKAEICKLLNVDLLIDDSYEIAIECATKFKIPVVLLDYKKEYGWTKGKIAVPRLVKRVSSWEEAEDAIKKIIK